MKAYVDVLKEMKPTPGKINSQKERIDSQGNRVLVNLMEDGTMQPVKDYLPAPELKSTGDGTGTMYDTNTGLTTPHRMNVNGLPMMVRQNLHTGQFFNPADMAAGAITQNPVTPYDKPESPHEIPTAQGWTQVFNDGRTNQVMVGGKPAMPTSTIIHNNVTPVKYEEDDPLISRIAQYMAPPPTPGRAGSPQAVQAYNDRMKAILKANPQYDPLKYATAQAVMLDFASHGGAKSTEAMNALGTHMGELNDAIDALHNKNIEALNSIGNRYNVSVRGLPPAAAFKTIVNRVKSEVVRAYDGSAGAMGDRDAAAADFNENLAPQILKQNVQKTVRLLRGKADSMKNRFETNAPGRKFEGYISPGTLATFDRLDPLNQQQGGGGVEQYSRSTGRYRYSLDGGNTWLPGRLPR
jgi:hypothetical protein